MLHCHGALECMGYNLKLKLLFALLVLTQLCINLSAGESPVSSDVLEKFMIDNMGKANRQSGVLRIVHKYVIYTCSGSIRMLPRKELFNAEGKRMPKIHAKGNGNSVHDEILIESLDMEGRVRLQSAVLGHYICYSKSGRLKPRDKGNKILCQFDRIVQNDTFMQFRSRHNPNWFLGFDKITGKPLHYRPNRNRKFSKKIRKECTQFVAHDKSAEDTQPTKGRATEAPKLDLGDLDHDYMMNYLNISTFEKR